MNPKQKQFIAVIGFVAAILFLGWTARSFLPHVTAEEAKQEEHEKEKHEGKSKEKHDEDEHEGHDEHEEHDEHEKKGKARSKEKHDEHEGHDEHEEHDEHEKEGKARSKEKHDEHEGHDEHEEHDEHETKGKARSKEKHDQHEGHDEHEGHGHEKEGEAPSKWKIDQEEGAIVRIDPSMLKELGIKVAAAGPGRLSKTVALPGSISFNNNRVVHVVPRAEGVAREVLKNVGDTVKKGDVLAVLDSSDVGETALQHMSAHNEFDLAKAELDRIRLIVTNTRKMLAILEKETDPEKVADQLEGLKIGEAKAELLENLTEIGLARPAYEKQKKLFEWQKTIHEATSQMLKTLKGVTGSEDAAKKIAGLRVGEAKAEILEALTARELAQVSLSKAEKLFQFQEPIYKNTLEMLTVFKGSISATAAREKIKGLNVGEAKKEIIEALATVELAKANFKRQQQLLKENVGSMRALQEAQKDLDSSASAYDSLLEQVRLTAEQDFLEARQEYLTAKQEQMSAVTTYPALREQIAVASESEYLEQEKELLESLGEWISARSSFTARMEQVAFDSDVELLTAEKTFKLAQHQLRIAEDKLLVLGLSHDWVEELTHSEAARITHLPVTAPFAGTVVEKHISLGEVVGDDSDLFLIADLSTVWVNLSVYQKDLPYVARGQKVHLSAGHGLGTASGTISYISPVLSASTRTALARIALPNPEGKWRPGLFVNADIAVGSIEVPVLVPKGAVLLLQGETVVFVETDEGFKPELVKTGRSNKTHIEVLSGLSKGRRYAASGAFSLKAHIITSGLDAHAGHGH